MAILKYALKEHMVEVLFDEFFHNVQVYFFPNTAWLKLLKK